MIGADICSGIGGLTAGFISAGWRIRLGVEKNKETAERYVANTGVSVVEKSVRCISGEHLKKLIGEKISILIGGPPCRAFSLANRKNSGVSHPAFDLIRHFMRTVGEILPEVFVMENVPSLLNFYSGFKRIQKKYELKGYSIEKFILNASDFGVPQSRKRVFVIGVKNYRGLLKEDMDFELLKLKSMELTVADAISDLPNIAEGGGGFNGDYSKKAKTEYQKLMRRGSKTVKNHITPRHSGEVIETIKRIPPGKSLKEVYNLLPTELQRYGSLENLHSNIYRRLVWSEISPTIVHPRRAMLVHPASNRILSVREAARLQCLFDFWKFSTNTNDGYQEVADAVPFLLARSVGTAVLRIL